MDQAIGEYQRALQNNPRDQRLYISLGSLFESRGEWQQAEDQYHRALQVQPDYPVVANNFAYLLLEHGGDMNTAMTYAQTARKGLPDLPDSADTLGWAYYLQGAYSSAIDLLREAAKGSPDNPTYHYHLGMAYQKSSNFPKAKQKLELALKLNPKYPHADEIKKVLAQSARNN